MKKKPIQKQRGGHVLLKEHGPDYFSKLAKKGIEKRRKIKEEWEQMKKAQVKKKR